MWTIAELKRAGSAAFKANYWRCVGASILLTISLTVSGGFGGGFPLGGGEGEGDISIKDVINNASFRLGMSPGAFLANIAGLVGIVLLMSFLLRLFVMGPLQVGCQGFFMRNHMADGRFGYVLGGFSVSYFRNILAMFLMNLFIALGFIALIVPGIILSYSFRLVPFVLMDNPNMSAMEALRESRMLMKGHKMHSFGLDLSFIGWILLSVVTCGILAIFYVGPYINSTDAALYMTLTRGNRNTVESVEYIE